MPTMPITIDTGDGGKISAGPTGPTTDPTGTTIIFGHPLPGGGEIGVGVYKPIKGNGPIQYGLGFTFFF